MEKLDSKLILAVQDLYDIYQQVSPAGPHRNSLLSAPPEPDRDWPAIVAGVAGVLDTLIRGTSCLLANDLAGATPPLLSALWRRITRLDRDLSPPPPPAYYLYLEREIGTLTAGNGRGCYRLFGEVLAVYLDILLAQQPQLADAHRPRVNALRGTVAGAA